MIITWLSSRFGACSSFEYSGRHSLAIASATALNIGLILPTICDAQSGRGYTERRQDHYGNEHLPIGVAMSAPFQSVGCVRTSYNSCTINITFAPVVVGPANAVIVVNDGTALGHQQVTLSGTGIASMAVKAIHPAAEAEVLAVSTMGTPQAAPHPRYRLIDLGTFGPRSYVNIPDLSYARVLNNRGVVAGWADTSTPDPFPDSCVDEDCFVAHAFRWKNGAKQDLGVLPGGASSDATWISDNGLIAGDSQNGETDPLIPGLPQIRAVLWKHGEMIDLGTLDGGYESITSSVNSQGQVVGLALNGIPDPDSMFGHGYQARAYLWQNGAMQDLGTLGGPDAWAGASAPRAACGSTPASSPLATCCICRPARPTQLFRVRTRVSATTDDSPLSVHV